jgi:catechol 2,3-dioxygenase-like lactoylglutathione lyase family enzyme
LLTNFIVTRDIARSRRFYVDVLAGVSGLSKVETMFSQLKGGERVVRV